VSLLPKISARITVKKNKKQIGSSKSASLDVNDKFYMFRMKLYDIIFKKADVSQFDDHSIKLFAAWKTRSTVQGNKKPLYVNECVDFNDESDYEGVVQEVQATHDASKTGLAKMMLCILADITVDEGERQETEGQEGGIRQEDGIGQEGDISVLEMSLPKSKVIYNKEYC
jgi:hypothetical protein